MDIFPPVEIRNERTRLNMFYEEVCSRWEELFEKLVASDTEFKISKAFRERPGVRGPSIPVDTFTLTPRGPVFVFPVLLPKPVGKTGLEGTYIDKFNEVRELFFSALTNLKIMRVGMVRDLVFGTSETPCQHMLANQSSFSGADLLGGKCQLSFRDAKCNIRLEFGPVEVTKTTQLPVGTRVNQHAGYGLLVKLDVNNSEIRPLDDADIQGILERAASLWPDELLDYLNERSAR
ncbi:MAG: hypothetical protein ACE5I3_04405 [Phycisphaerae bacterium]